MTSTKSFDFSVFPSNFIWATASAAYQIEEPANDQGRGISTWDAIRSEKGRIADESDALLSCHGRSNMENDIELLKTLNVTAYRFSISWSRILPNGTMGSINSEGIEYYRSVCRCLLDNEIEPIVTLFHADMPLSIYDSGTWINKDNVEHFVDFARLCFESFGDLVKKWITFNEISMQAWCGIVKTEGNPWHCPNREYPQNIDEIPYLATKNMLIAHAKVYRLYEKDFKSQQNGLIGITGTGRWCIPKNNSPENVQAAHRAIDFLVESTVEPLFTGEFPESMQKSLTFLENFTENEKVLLEGSVDFLGFNYYLTHVVSSSETDIAPTTAIERQADFRFVEDDTFEKICGETWVRFAPDGLFQLLSHVKDKYKNIPVLITENGCMDMVGEQIRDPLQDDHRQRYIQGHIEAVAKALAAGCSVIGYTVWCFYDNFEWDDGFAMRFGIFRVDYEDEKKKRAMKKSGEFYANFIDQFKKYHHLK